MPIDYEFMSKFEREEVQRAADEIAALAKRHGSHCKKSGEANILFLGLFNLATSMSNYAKLNGTFNIWASFTPALPDYETNDEAYSEQE